MRKNLVADACSDGRPSFTSTNSLLVATDNVSGIGATASFAAPKVLPLCCRVEAQR